MSQLGEHSEKFYSNCSKWAWSACAHLSNELVVRLVGVNIINLQVQLRSTCLWQHSIVNCYLLPPGRGYSICKIAQRYCAWGFSSGSVVKNPPANAGDIRPIHGLGRFPGEGNDNLLQQSCLGNPMDRGACQTTCHGVTKESDVT